MCFNGIFDKFLNFYTFEIEVYMKVYVNLPFLHFGSVYMKSAILCEFTRLSKSENSNDFGHLQFSKVHNYLANLEI